MVTETQRGSITWPRSPEVEHSSSLISSCPSHPDDLQKKTKTKTNTKQSETEGKKVFLRSHIKLNGFTIPNNLRCHTVL